jgi:hypothetical protein
MKGLKCPICPSHPTGPTANPKSAMGMCHNLLANERPDMEDRFIT